MGTARFSFNGDGKSPEPKKMDERKKQVVQALDQRFKPLNKLWEEAEAYLREIPIPADVSISYDPEPEDPYRPNEFQIRQNLGFVRSKGGWRICHCETNDAFDALGFDWKPISESTLDVRVAAIPQIDRLREAVLKKAEEVVPKLDEAIAKLRSTIASW